MMNNITNIQNKIFTYRNTQVMVDRDLASLFGVETKVLNQAVKRNIERFPASFRFQLTKTEKNELVTNCDQCENLKHNRFLIIDNKIVYHIGASLKDLGKKWFAFSKMEMQASTILTNLNVAK